MNKKFLIVMVIVTFSLSLMSIDKKAIAGLERMVSNLKKDAKDLSLPREDRQLFLESAIYISKFLKNESEENVKNFLETKKKLDNFYEIKAAKKKEESCLAGSSSKPRKDPSPSIED